MNLLKTTKFNNHENMFLQPCTGSSILINFTEQFNLLKNFENDRKRNVVKGCLRLIVANIALEFFATIGVYYNLSAGTIKGILGVIAFNKAQPFLGLPSKAFLEQSKRHLVKCIGDIVVITLSIISCVLYAVSPQNIPILQERIEGLLL